MKNLPALNDSKPLEQNVIKAIAMDIGKDTVDYIERMYPKAVMAASSTFKLSLRNHIYNEIMAAIKLNDEGKILARLEWRKRFRRHLKKYKKTHNMEGLASLKKEGDNLIQEALEGKNG